MNYFIYRAHIMVVDSVGYTTYCERYVQAKNIFDAIALVNKLKHRTWTVVSCTEVGEALVNKYEEPT